MQALKRWTVAITELQQNSVVSIVGPVVSAIGEFCQPPTFFNALPLTGGKEENKM
jgi:hypothetical protein